MEGSWKCGIIVISDVHYTLNRVESWERTTPNSTSGSPCCKKALIPPCCYIHWTKARWNVVWSVNMPKSSHFCCQQSRPSDIGEAKSGSVWFSGEQYVEIRTISNQRYCRLAGLRVTWTASVVVATSMPHYSQKLGLNSALRAQFSKRSGEYWPSLVEELNRHTIPY